MNKEVPILPLEGAKADEAQAREQFSAWLKAFSSAIAGDDVQAITDLFIEDGSWKDMLALDWDYGLSCGWAAIADGMARKVRSSGFGKLRPARRCTPPQARRRGGREVIDCFFEFSVAAGQGLAFVRLVDDGRDLPRAWMLMTTLQELDCAPEQVGRRRPSGNEFAHYQTTENWADRRARDVLYEDRDPEVVVIGGGQSALALAAHLKTRGVDVLIVERTRRVGDSWRERYHSLSLHNPTYANHMPYLPFPSGWPRWLAKDKLAAWLEAYAETMELNIWLDTSVTGARFDEDAKSWTVRLRRGDGTERTISCRQLVFATGISGSIPNMPTFPGIETFQGTVVHSAHFGSASDYSGKTALVIGTGNSGHDMAQDLVLNGAGRVIMLQRGPTCVVSLNPTAERVFAIYDDDQPIDEVDIKAAAIPYPVFLDTYKWLVRRAQADDAEMIRRLNERGLKTYYGSDGTGFHMMYLRGEGGYYIDVGCADLIAEGKVEILSNDLFDRFVANGIRLKDGTVIALDLVVAATGFRNMQENIRTVLGDEVADRVGPVWGMDAGYTQHNIWRRTAQEGFWVMGGGLVEGRLFSRMLALQITAALRGLIEAKA